MNPTLRLRKGGNPTSSSREKRKPLWGNLRLRLGISIIAIFVIGSFVLPLFTTVDPSQQGTYLKNLPLSGTHLLGTNALGQDIFWYLVFAIRNSLILGVTVSVSITIISTLVGLSAGYLGGWYERIIMLVIDTFITIPILPILMIILSALAKTNTSFVVIGMVLVIFGWAWGARTVRSMALSLREREFVNMARFSGANSFSILMQELFPYVYAYIVVNFINTILFAINTEAALAVIGLSKIEVPTLGSILFWALNYNALLIGQLSWLVAPIVATIVLFLGLFLASTGYNEFSATRRGVA